MQSREDAKNPQSFALRTSAALRLCVNSLLFCEEFILKELHQISGKLKSEALRATIRK